jgi:hypothetical protein
MENIFLDDVNINNYLQKVIFYKLELEKKLAQMNKVTEEININYKSQKNNNLIEENIEISKENYKVLNENINKYIEVILNASNKYQILFTEMEKKLDEVNINMSIGE